MVVGYATVGWRTLWLCMVCASGWLADMTVYFVFFSRNWSLFDNLIHWLFPNPILKYKRLCIRWSFIALLSQVAGRTVPTGLPSCLSQTIPRHLLPGLRYSVCVYLMLDDVISCAQALCALWYVQLKVSVNLSSRLKSCVLMQQNISTWYHIENKRHSPVT
jgi:hypothetical protein